MEEKLIVILGTSADPPHLGHINLIVNGVNSLSKLGYKIVEVMVIPVYRHPVSACIRKIYLPETFAHRLAMCTLDAREIEKQVAGEVGRVVVSRLDETLAKNPTKTNYSVETLEVIRESTNPGIGLTFLIGEDLVSGEQPILGKWHQLEKIIQLTSLVIYPRPGHKSNKTFIEKLLGWGAHCIFLDQVPVSDITSSQIKQRILSGEDPGMLCREGLITEPVALYIKRNDLAGLWHK